MLNSVFLSARRAAILCISILPGLFAAGTAFGQAQAPLPGSEWYVVFDQQTAQRSQPVYNQPAPQPVWSPYGYRATPVTQVAQKPAETETAPRRTSQNPLWGYISELRIGASLHNTGPIASKTESGVDLDLEVFLDEITWFNSWLSRGRKGGFLEFLLTPRPQFGVHINSKFETNQLWGGFGWTHIFWENWLAEFTFGFTIHDGKLTDSTGERRELGSRILFRESVALGYLFGHRNQHNITVYFDHISNGGVLGSPNEGMDNTGIRYGYRF